MTTPVTIDELLAFLHMAKVFNKSHELAERIKQHGIAPPEGLVLVKEEVLRHYNAIPILIDAIVRRNPDSLAVLAKWDVARS